MTHLKAQIPQDVEAAFDHALGPSGHLPGQHEEQVEVGIGRHLGASRAANRHQRQAFGLGRVGAGVQIGGGHAQRLAHHPVGQKGIGPQHPARGQRLLCEGRGDGGARSVLNLVQHRDRRGADVSGIAQTGQVGIQPVSDGACVKYLGPRKNKLSGVR